MYIPDTNKTKIIFLPTQLVASSTVARMIVISKFQMNLALL